jgi:SOS response associated peptidase (SRAP)
MALAGLWESSRSPAGERVLSFAILTTRANALYAALHDRMPVILGLHNGPAWLGEESVDDPAQLKAMLAPYPLNEMMCWLVSPRVGNVKNNDQSLIEPIAGRDRQHSVCRPEVCQAGAQRYRRASPHAGARRLRYNAGRTKPGTANLSAR